MLTGDSITTHLGKGQGPDELPAADYLQPLLNSDKWVALDGDYGLTLYDPKSKKVTYRSRINLEIGEAMKHKNDYSAPFCYSIVDENAFGVKFLVLNDSTWLLPISIWWHAFDKVDERQADEARIFCELDLKDMKRKNLSGHLPAYYKEHALWLDDFNYDIDLSTGYLYVSHEPDSLIYVYATPDSLLYTIGYEMPINRDFTFGYEDWPEKLEKDFGRAGRNQELEVLEDEGMIIRTGRDGYYPGVVYIQVYDMDGNLMAQRDMPNKFRFLGVKDGHFYGVKFSPNEEDNNIIFTLYTFDICK
ncbi:MAG: hypothetical protein LIO90_08130 [Bacteroidales bacterium]|nr:hypothetical protein [Bacteroidales bacterium]